ncbi:MAG: DEAD/DEAH box helicase [Candidatus Aminicenantes bacterium]|nr:DEAD/DEAH box helicase [Candidatus Aminicenantes bacterium]
MIETASTRRRELLDRYLRSLPFEPYVFQRDALEAWYASGEDLLVTSPTGTGKTLIAEGALFEALHGGRTAYYTTPLIALTEQKFREMQAAAKSWGFPGDSVGLVTGNRQVNPDAPVRVVVAEILLNRLLRPGNFDFDRVAVVVKDEFHTFRDPERGIVWELSLSLLPRHVRLLLLSATVGRPESFTNWLRKSHGRRMQLLQGRERRVPLTYQWVDDLLLEELLVELVRGGKEGRRSPCLVFCFNRRECWSVAERLKGRPLVDGNRKRKLAARLRDLDLSDGAGPILRQLLLRGVGIHHAGVLPKYRRVVERLFQRRLLPVVICTETLSAGINLPARSVVLTSLVKGPPRQKRILDATIAHQIFGRAGRPRWDRRGFVLALAPEEEVKLLRRKRRLEAIPARTRKSAFRQARKSLARKMRSRRRGRPSWDRSQFRRLVAARPAALASRGPLPWRYLAYLLKRSPQVDEVRTMVGKRLLSVRAVQSAQRALDDMLLTLWRGGYVTLDPEPPPENEISTDYRPVLAQATFRLDRLLAFRGINPLYGDFLGGMLPKGSRSERIQALESVLELSGAVARAVPVPESRRLDPGPLETTCLDPELARPGRAGGSESTLRQDLIEAGPGPTLAAKLRLVFDGRLPQVTQLKVRPVWAAGDLLELGGNFNRFVHSRGLVRQEGILFRHMLRLALLCGEFAALPNWDAACGCDLEEVALALRRSCRRIDPESTDRFLERSGDFPVAELQRNANHQGGGRRSSRVRGE